MGAAGAAVGRTGHGAAAHQPSDPSGQSRDSGFHLDFDHGQTRLPNSSPASSAEAKSHSTRQPPAYSTSSQNPARAMTAGGHVNSTSVCGAGGGEGGGEGGVEGLGGAALEARALEAWALEAGALEAGL